MEEGLKLGQGREKAKIFLEEHPELAQILETKIKEQCLGNSVEDINEIDEATVDMDEE